MNTTSSNSSEAKSLDKPRAESETHWERLDALSDEEIDTSDIPPLTEEDFVRSTWRLPPGMKPTKPLADAEVNNALAGLSGWETTGWKSPEEIRKVFKFPSFAEAWKFADHFVKLAGGLEPHINLEICRPGTEGGFPVRVSLGYQGSITQEDLVLAQRIENELLTL